MAADLLKAFIIGSSLPAAAVTWTYTGLAFHRTDHNSIVHYETLPFITAGILGAANILGIYLQKNNILPSLTAQAVAGRAKRRVHRRRVKYQTAAASSRGGRMECSGCNSPFGQKTGRRASACMALKMKGTSAYTTSHVSTVETAARDGLLEKLKNR